MWPSAIERCYRRLVSSIRQDNGDDFPEAAQRHLDDIQALCDARRFDGAAYLSGYAIECSLKAVVFAGEIARQGSVAHSALKAELARGSKTRARFDRVARDAARQDRGHDLAHLASQVATYRATLSGATASYAVDVSKGPFKGWSPKLRYCNNGKTAETEVRAWAQEAQTVFNNTVGRMILDGLVTL